MIVAIGLDVCDNRRVAKVIERFGMRFCKRILSPKERIDLESQSSVSAFMARRIAAKEAAVKALGTGIAMGVGWQEIVIDHLVGGRPALSFFGVAQQLIEQMGVSAVHLSITDERHLAAAVVIMEKDTKQL